LWSVRRPVEDFSRMAVLSIVAPIFALIALGFLAARLRYFSEGTQKGLAEFTFGFAMPALLFRTLAAPQDMAISPIPIWLTYFGLSAVIWVLATLVTVSLLKRPMADAASIAMSSVYGNIVMLGIPIVVAMHGPAATAPMAAIIMLNSPVLWLVGTLHLTLADRPENRSFGQAARTTAFELARNPIILGIFAGVLWRFTGLGLAAPVDKTLSLLGQAGIPCALVVLGVSLADFEIKGQLPTLSSILVLKLAVMPAVAWVIATQIVGLPPVAAAVVTIFAATPTGANAYLFATRNGRVVNSASGAVALGTMLSLATISLLIAVLT
jgi:malonate transporter and related proteins